MPQNVLKVWKLLVLADMKYVLYRRYQQLSSCYGAKWFLVQQLLKRLTNVRQNNLLFTIILQRIIANMPAALYQNALELVSTGQCATALIHLNSSEEGIVLCRSLSRGRSWRL